jgi:hypothetical protein
MRKIIFIFLILILCLGCNKNGVSSQITEEEFHIGNDGLLFSFMDNMPPMLVYEQENFPVSLKIENKGAFDITNGVLILNVEKDNINVKEGTLKRSIKLYGKSFGIPYGETDAAHFLLSAKELDKETETITSTVLATICYKYETDFTSTVCVDTDFYNTKNVQKACSAQSQTFSSGQGGPVSITNIEASMTQEDNMIKPVYTITIDNVGGGLVIESDSVTSACSAEPVSKDDINKLEITAKFAGDNTPLTCKLSSSKLKNNEIIARCISNIGIDESVPAYNTVLQVSLSYGYTQTISKSFEIRSTI